ncbi:MAG: glutathione S-transferase family protein [Hyphomicrobiales bacterium]|nr:glutathione S-transferase family protein [Hyphomicrobiales bacterium]
MIELYFYRHSVCSQRVLMTLAEKEIEDWTAHHLDLFKGEQTSLEYLELNPKAQVPTLIHEGQIIRESSIICEYLDDISAANPLKPNNGYAKYAQMREWIKEGDEAGFQGVGSLSFATVFRKKLLKITENERNKMWAEQTDISRTYRQKSCFEDGLESPYAIIALAAWERIFGKLEKAFSDDRRWIMGNQFTLADISYAPLIARLEAIGLLGIWLDHRIKTKRWWNRIKLRPSFLISGAEPGSREQQESFAGKGHKIADLARQILLGLT